MRLRHTARLLLVFSLSLSLALPADDEATPDPWKELITAIDLIRNDATAARLAAAEWSCETFEPLSDPADQHLEEAAELLQFLISFAGTSSDTWLVDRLAVSMAECSEQRWSPLFLDLLDHRSTQVRWRAIQHYAWVSDPIALPTLEAFWNEELPPWVRADLADALLENGSDEHVEDCVDLIDSKNIDLARAALRTLKLTRPGGALEVLRRHARNVESHLREPAVEALAAWPENEEAMRLLVDLSQSAPAPIADRATTALSSFSQPAALDRLVEVALDPEAAFPQRSDALRAVAASDHPDVIQVLMRVFDEAKTDESIFFRRLAHGGLSRLGVEIPTLEPLPGKISVSFTLTCSAGAISELKVLVPVGEHSVRCWAAPGIAGDPTEYERLGAGTPVIINDHFRSGNEHWVQVRGESCWVPSEQLGEPVEYREHDPDWQFHHEFDVPLAEIDSPMGKALMAAGMIRVFDVAETVAGIYFEIDPADREQVERLADLYVNDESAMSYFVWDAMDELEDRYEGDAELGRKIIDALGE